MESSTRLIISVSGLTLLAGLLSLANIALAKFRAYIDEDENHHFSFFENLSLKISSDFRKFSTTFEISRIIILFIIVLRLNDFILQISQSNNILKLPNFLIFFGNNSKSLGYLIVILIIIPVLYLIIEILPKSFSGKFYVRYSLISALPVYLLHIVLTPIRLMFTLPERLFIYLFRNSNESENLNSEEQIREIIEESTKAGNIELNESKLIDNIFDFKDTIVRQVMTTRSKIISIGIDWTYLDVIETIKNEGYSRYPVFKNNLDNVIGILHTKDIVGINIPNDSLIQKSIIRPTIFIKEEDFIDDLLREFQRKKIQMAIVTDEFGGTSGIITMEDILEEIVGEINDEHDEINKDIEIIDANNYIVVAAVHIRDLNEVLPEMLPESEDYESLGGLITTETETIPDLNAEIKIGNYLFFIMKRTRTKIEKVKITYSPSSESEE